MSTKALILDLDNTIYPVSSIGEELFAPLFKLIDESGSYEGDFDEIKSEIMKKPFQVVAKQFHFSNQLSNKGLELLKNAEFNGPMETFPDYPETRKIAIDKYLVTTGFNKLQHSKIKNLGIAEDFRKIHIVDPATSNDTKKIIFQKILVSAGIRPSEALVVGDDPNSEIIAAQELGIPVVLYNPTGMANNSLPEIANFKELPTFVK